MADIDEMMQSLNKALIFAKEKHSGQKRKNGEDYINHPLKVAIMLSDAGYGIDYVLAGIFHDLLEDTDATEEEILTLSNKDVLESVKLLTKTKGVSGKDYIDKILKNPIAKAVKNADRIQNLQDAMDGDPKFAIRYAKNTKEYYVKKFSRELNEQYEKLCEKLGISEYDYTIDGSCGPHTPVYRSNSCQAWYFDCSSGKWVETDPYFWAELDDNAENISEEEALKRIQPYLK